MASRQHATGWASDAPTPAQLKEFFDQISSGRMTQARLQPVLNNKPMPETVHVSGEYAVTVYKGPTAIARHLHEGYPQQKDYFGVSDENYPQGIYTTPDTARVRLVYFGRNIGNDEAMREFDRFGFKAARPPAVLGLGAQYPSLLQRHSRIVALGQLERKENFAVCIQLEKGNREAWSFPEDIWRNKDTEVRFAVEAKE